MPEKKSTSTTSKSVADNGPAGTDLGQASYRAEQAHDAVIIFAFGWHPTPGYTDFFEQSPIDIFPPQFIFHSIPPYGIVPQVLAPFAIWVMFGATEPIKTVTVHDADGAHEITVEQMSKTVAESRRATWVAGNVVRGGGIGSRASTLGIGEEEPSTRAFGEEEFLAPTTMATGEEGGGGPTTMATGEEEARATFGGPPITTLAVAEEAVFTTLRLGEEGDGGTTAAATTLDLGEESQTFRVANTTLALGEEDPNPTTLAVGEENPTTQAVGEEGGGPTTLALGEETTTFVRSSPFGNF